MQLLVGMVRWGNLDKAVVAAVDGSSALYLTAVEAVGPGDVVVAVVAVEKAGAEASLS